jgi:predicted nucleotidyltransferase
VATAKEPQSLKEKRRKKNVRPEEIKEVEDFVSSVLQSEAKDYVKSIVLVGSAAREEDIRNIRDIDLLVIVDDLRPGFPGEKEICKVLEDLAERISERLSLQCYILTEFWRYVMEAHPIIYSFIKDGKAAYDPIGLFESVKRLQEKGEIRYTPEAIENCIKEAAACLARMKKVRLLMIAEDAYKCMVRCGEAVLMKLRKEVPPPRELKNSLREVFETFSIDPKYLKWLDEIVSLRKMIENHKIISVSGDQLDLWMSRCEEFYEKMLAILTIADIMETRSIIEKAEKVLNEAVRAALTEIGENLEGMSDDAIIELFKKRFIDTGLIESSSLELWDELKMLREKIEEEKNLELIYEIRKRALQKREDVRFFIHHLADAAKKYKRKQQN